MFATIVRANRALSMVWRKFARDDRAFRAKGRIFGGPWVVLAAGAIGGCAAVLCCLNESSVRAMETLIALPSYPWEFTRTFKSLDHATLRRGWTVYRTVCRTCHSLKFVRFLHLVGASHSAEEVAKLAEEFEVEDGPDEEGNLFTRPAKLNDTIPSTFPNEEAAKAANSGAHPPDLTYYVESRYNGVNYVFSYLTGFMDPPAGMRPEEGQHFNIYFPAAFTMMPEILFEGAVEYDDGTAATPSQMAKDVAEFLAWTASPEHDTRKMMTIKGFGAFLLMVAGVFHMYRRNWSQMKSRRIAYVPSVLTGEPRPPDFLFGKSADSRSKRSATLSNR